MLRINRWLKNFGFIALGFVLSAYLFLVNGHRVVEEGSTEWQQTIDSGVFAWPELLDTELYSNGYVLDITGIAKNPGKRSVPFLKVSADLINNEGLVYHKCTGFTESVPAGSEIQFKMHCANIKDIDYKSHASVKIYQDT
mgnify:CR=1 FL=1